VSEARVAVAPEASESVRAAQAVMEQEARKAELVGDPTAPALAAMAAMLGGMNKLFVDGSLTLGQLIAAAKRPINEDDIRQLTEAAATGAERAANRLAQAANRRQVTAMVGFVVGALLIGISVGWLCHSFWPVEGLPGFTCEDQPDGSRVCYEFVRPPAATQH
jgi:hypothetical protein